MRSINERAEGDTRTWDYQYFFPKAYRPSQFGTHHIESSSNKSNPKYSDSDDIIVHSDYRDGKHITSWDIGH